MFNNSMKVPNLKLSSSRSKRMNKQKSTRHTHKNQFQSPRKNSLDYSLYRRSYSPQYKYRLNDQQMIPSADYGFNIPECGTNYRYPKGFHEYVGFPNQYLDYQPQSYYFPMQKFCQTKTNYEKFEDLNKEYYNSAYQWKMAERDNNFQNNKTQYKLTKDSAFTQTVQLDKKQQASNTQNNVKNNTQIWDQNNLKNLLNRKQINQPNLVYNHNENQYLHQNSNQQQKYFLDVKKRREQKQFPHSPIQNKIDTQHFILQEQDIIYSNSDNSHSINNNMVNKQQYKKTFSQAILDQILYKNGNKETNKNHQIKKQKMQTHQFTKNVVKTQTQNYYNDHQMYRNHQSNAQQKGENQQHRIHQDKNYQNKMYNNTYRQEYSNMKIDGNYSNQRQLDNNASYGHIRNYNKNQQNKLNKQTAVNLIVNRGEDKTKYLRNSTAQTNDQSNQNSRNQIMQTDNFKNHIIFERVVKNILNDQQFRRRINQKTDQFNQIKIQFQDDSQIGFNDLISSKDAYVRYSRQFLQRLNSIIENGQYTVFQTSINKNKFNSNNITNQSTQRTVKQNKLSQIYEQNQYNQYNQQRMTPKLILDQSPPAFLQYGNQPYQAINRTTQRPQQTVIVSVPLKPPTIVPPQSPQLNLYNNLGVQTLHPQPQQVLQHVHYRRSSQKLRINQKTN